MQGDLHRDQELRMGDLGCPSRGQEKEPERTDGCGARGDQRAAVEAGSQGCRDSYAVVMRTTSVGMTGMSVRFIGALQGS